jgi:hypothetical protein
MDLRADLDAVEKIIISYRCLESNLAFYPVARRYTD